MFVIYKHDKYMYMYGYNAVLYLCIFLGHLKIYNPGHGFSLIVRALFIFELHFKFHLY